VWNPDTNNVYEDPNDWPKADDEGIVKDELCGEHGDECPEVPAFNGEDYFDDKPLGCCYTKEQQALWGKWVALKKRVARLEGAVRYLRGVEKTVQIKPRLSANIWGAPDARMTQQLRAQLPSAPAQSGAGADDGGQEFDAQRKAWHQQHPEASLDEERSSWNAHQTELRRITAWEARRERRMQMKKALGLQDEADLLSRQHQDGRSAVKSLQEEADLLSHEREAGQVEDGSDERSVGGVAVEEEQDGVHEEAEPAESQESQIPATVGGQPDYASWSEGTPDFNGADAVIARHAFMGYQPTDLEERGGESRGQFNVVASRSGFDDEGEVQLAVYGPAKTPIRCKIRGFRKLSGDFQGNAIATGFEKSWGSGEGLIQTGPISPGVTNEYDILTCQDEVSGSEENFRLSWGSNGYKDLDNHGPLPVVGPHFGMNTDSVTFDMDRPTFEDARALEDYATLTSNP
jgi:hypothetical protein